MTSYPTWLVRKEGSLGLAWNHRLKVTFDGDLVLQGFPRNLEDAYKQGWRPLTEILGCLSSIVPKRLRLRHTFHLWRARKLIPPSIRPKRGWMDGNRTVLWPPELEEFLRDALRFRPYAHMRGQRHHVAKYGATHSHAALRLLLWAYGWDYGRELIGRDIKYVMLQFRKVVFPKRQIAKVVWQAFVRWFFNSPQSLVHLRQRRNIKIPRRGAREFLRMFLALDAATKSRTPRTRLSKKDQESMRALKSFTDWGSVVSWAEADLSPYLNRGQALRNWTLKAILDHVRDAGDREFDIVRDQAQRVLHALFPKGSQTEYEDWESPRHPFGTGMEIAWMVLKPLVTGPSHMTSPEEIEAIWQRWNRNATSKARAMLRAFPGRYVILWDGIYDTDTGQRIDPRGRPIPRTSASSDVIGRLLRYLGVFVGWEIATLHSAQVAAGPRRPIHEIVGYDPRKGRSAL